ncbi:MAG: PQQ-dependent sugar dehydrogenase [Hyphomicrobiaceae bacterium]|nr:PQQ-dependent sugar dehydrogenase [Hyphomicrobiaceae bacterium]
MLPTSALLRAGLLLVLLLPSGPRASAEQSKAPAAPTTAVSVVKMAGGLEHPWGLQFLPDGRLLVTERPGRLRIVTRDGRLLPPVEGVPKVAATGQGGLLDVVLAPDFAATGTIYLAFAEPRGGSQNGTALARGRLLLDPGRERLDDVAVIFRQEPASTGGLHFGSRLLFGRDGKLYMTLGERFQMAFAQDLARHWGKVVRLEPDGSAPPDNPFVGRAGARPEIWSYGHRNPQSAALHPSTGGLWVVEHGPKGGDEINIVKRGANYGWPVIGYGIDYSGARLHETTHKEGMEQPVYYWDPSIAPSGMAFYTASLFPQWRGNLLVGGLDRTLRRLVLDGEKVVAEEVLLRDRRERIRDVREGPDGAVWLLTDAPAGSVLKVVPRG